MRSKALLAILSTVIMLIFLGISIYQLGRAFSGQVEGNDYNAAQIVGWTSLVLFFIGIGCLILVLRSDPAHI